MAANLPEGYYARPIDMEDTRKIAELFDAQARWLNGSGESIDDRTEELRLEWGADFFHITKNGLAVFRRDHQVATSFFSTLPENTSRPLIYHWSGEGNIFQVTLIRINPITNEITRAIKPTSMKRARPLLSRFKR